MSQQTEAGGEREAVRTTRDSGGRSGTFPTTKNQGPGNNPQQRGEAAEHEEHAPAIEGNQPDARGVDERLSQPDPDEIAGIHEPAFGIRKPVGHRAGARRKCDRLAHAHRDPEAHDRRDVAEGARQRAGDRPHHKPRRVGATDAEAVHHPARRHLHEAVAPRKRRQHQPHRFRVDPELANHERSGDRERAALRVAECHAAREQHGEPPSSGGGPSGVSARAAG